jgi:hypothetical protein
LRACQARDFSRTARTRPGQPGSVATYVTGDGRLLPLWTEDEVAYSYEVIELCRGRQVVAA